jgi:hypothetical protein
MKSTGINDDAYLLQCYHWKLTLRKQSLPKNFLRRMNHRSLKVQN